MEESFLSIKEFAKLVGVHYNTVLRSIKSGRLNAFRIGSGKKATYRIARSETHRLALFDLKDLIKEIIKEEK